MSVLPTLAPIVRCLQILTLFLPAGRITAIVGANGAGKSTLVKLLCRLYDPSSGKISFDGTDTRSYDPEALRKAVSVIFQDPVEYHDTASRNIAFGDLAGDPDESPASSKPHRPLRRMRSWRDFPRDTRPFSASGLAVPS